MSRRSTLTAVALMACVGLGMAFHASPAEARTCTKLGFSVNDFGIEGPKRDAKRLLDGYIARWAREKGIKSYRTGRKKVTCELYLDLLVVDEHTCKAVASVCWNGPPFKVRKTSN
ncbi:MAG: hypothetical protein AAFR70_10270 [Pseudomonadota bacterium]